MVKNVPITYIINPTVTLLDLEKSIDDAIEKIDGFQAKCFSSG
jgi:hypothetical protein